jgi:hypothetical protein
MKQGKYICTLLVLVLVISGCQIGKTKHSESNYVANLHELVVKNRLSVPTPNSYSKIFPDNGLIIFSDSEFSVGYRWIDKKEIEFIGSNSSPYDFFYSALNNPTSLEEKRFLDGLGNIVDRSFISKNDMEFYLLDLVDHQKIYILSGSLEFVTEVTSSENSRSLFNNVVQHSYIK